MKKLYILFLSLFISSTLCCQNDTGKIIIDPESHIAKEINKRKIVMIGEHYHNHPSGYKEIIKILNEWIIQDYNTEKDTNKLNLILEIDEETADEINTFLITGDLSDLLDYFLPGVYYENIEFYSNLKKLHDSINKQNSKSNSFKKKFEVKGFEQVGFNVVPDLMKKPQYESEYWFIKERDSVTSYQMIDYVKNHEREKYLVFYGGLHLQKGLVSKNLGFIVSEDSCMGYYMADYLKKEFGDSNVLTINQFLIPQNILNNTKYESLKGKDFYLHNKDVIWEQLNPSQYDFFLIKPEIRIYSHRFNFVYSKKVFEKSIDKIRIYNNFLPGYKGSLALSGFFRNLYYLTGIKFKDVNELEKWFEKNQNFEFSYFDSKEFKDNIFRIYSTDVNDRRLKSRLIQLGFDESLYGYNSLDTLIWNKEVWPDAIKNIKFLNAIGIYWAGYPDEKVEAKKFLKGFSGEDYKEPEKYLQWWRNVYHNYGI